MLYLKCNQSINYDIAPPIAPKMPNLGKGAECIRLLLSQVSKTHARIAVFHAFPHTCCEQDAPLLADGHCQ